MTGRLLGWRVWGIGIAAMGLVSLMLGKFDPGQPVPAWFPAHTALAYAADLFMIAAGVAVQWRRTTRPAVLALTGYYLFVVVLVMNGRVVIAHPATYGTWEAVAMPIAIAAAGVMIVAPAIVRDPHRTALLRRAAQAAFGGCALVFGGAHFVYMNLTAPLVPTWLPPSQLFWGYATGVFHIAAGVAILTGLRARLAAVLLTIMFASFSILVHLPLLVGAPRTAFFWTENALNLALIGAAWVMADALRRGPAATA